MSVEILSVLPPDGETLRRIREGLGLSQSELAAVIGFSPLSGPKVVRDWEDGQRQGQPFSPTPTAWAALRYLVMLVRVARSDSEEDDVRSLARRLLPECLQ